MGMCVRAGQRQGAPASVQAYCRAIHGNTAAEMLLCGEAQCIGPARRVLIIERPVIIHFTRTGGDMTPTHFASWPPACRTT